MKLEKNAVDNLWVNIEEEPLSYLMTCLQSFKTRSQMTLDIPLSKRNIIQRGVSQLTFTCSKSAIETLEKGLKYVQSLQQKH